MKIVLIYGGWSKERDISLKSGEAVLKALDRSKYEIHTYDPIEGLEGLIKDSDKIDLALIFLHGKKGEDGSLQGFLELLDIPYMGSGVLASALAMNKEVSKRIFSSGGLKVPECISLSRDNDIDAPGIFFSLGRPVVLKPVSEGSSIGLSVCKDENEISNALADCFEMGYEVMAEEYIKGREISCGVIGNRKPEPLPVVEIIPSKEYQFFSYSAKYIPGASREICPARLPVDISKKIQEYAVKAHCLLGCRNLSRSDMIVAGREVYILETNTLPGMTRNSIFPLAAKAAGILFPDLLDRLITLALEK